MLPPLDLELSQRMGQRSRAHGRFLIIQLLCQPRLRALARFTPLRFNMPLRLTAHNQGLYGAGIRAVKTEDRRIICRSWRSD